ncbi:hypothetical protein FRB98_003500, partial [Tulasnella sp. 332]
LPTKLKDMPTKDNMSKENNETKTKTDTMKRNPGYVVSKRTRKNENEGKNKKENDYSERTRPQASRVQTAADEKEGDQNKAIRERKLAEVELEMVRARVQKMDAFAAI